MKIEKEQEDKIEQVKQTDIQRQLIYIGSLKPKKGHTLFEVNIKTGTIENAEFNYGSTIQFEHAKEGLKKSNKSVIKKPDCIYISALNKNNVINKLKANSK